MIRPVVLPAICFAFISVVATSHLHAKESRPNVVFILCDDLGAHDVGCFGSTFHETPNIDRLAQRGLRLTQAYAASPLCSPTRSSIMTGQYPARIGITSPSCHVPQIQLEKRLTKAAAADVPALSADSVTRLQPEYFTLAEAFREAGYDTAHFGKWHLGHNLPDRPDDHYEPKDQGFGFDFPHTPNAAGPGGGYLAPWKFIRDVSIIGKPGEHIEDRMADEAAKYIHAHADKPFFLNYWAYSVHSPWNARRDYIDSFQKKVNTESRQRNPLYAAMVKSLDDGVGRLFAAIEQSGAAERTIVVFFSDNGGWAYRPRATDPEGFTDVPATSNFPLRSGKASLYEGGTREPCIVVWPGKVKAGSADDSLFSSVDWYPTLLAMCDIKPHSDIKIDGQDQSSMFRGEGQVRRRAYCHFPHGSPKQSEEIPGFLPGTWVRDLDWKLIRFYADNEDGSDRFELYNLRDDIGESNNRVSAEPGRVREMNQWINEFLRDTEAVVPVRNPNFVPASLRKETLTKRPENTDDDPKLQGWKNRNCDVAFADGIVTVRGKQGSPFLGVSAGVQGPAKVTVRIHCSAGGEGKVEWLTAPTNTAIPKSKSFAISPGEWQTVEATIDADSPLGIVRVYVPAANQPVEIDWIEIVGKNRMRRWDF